MNIGLIDVDGHGYPNIALMKISDYHKNKGDNVEWANIGKYDKTYMSKLFNFTKDYECGLGSYGEIIKGGTGYDIKSKLDQDIEKSMLDYSIYPMYNFSVQFFSRGCIRKCEFCVVPEKEGLIKAVEPMNLNPKGEWIEVLDNNFFANKDWRESIDYLLKVGQPVNLHGVDVRIINEEQCYWLNKLKHRKQIHIAWDLPNIDILPKLKEMIKYVKPYKIMCYVLIGYNTTKDYDMYRIEKLRELGVSPFVMPFDKSDNYQKRIARWVNHKAIFNSVEFKDYK